MANTRQSSKRAKQAVKRQSRNIKVRSATRTALKKAVEAIQGKDLNQAKELYKEAIRTVSKAASKGVIPARRAARKVARLTKLAQKALPDALKK